MAVISMKQLLEAGVHFGHQTRRWNPKMATYIFTERNGIYIIDLQKTVKKLEEAYFFVRDMAASGKSILFVGTKKQANMKQLKALGQGPDAVEKIARERYFMHTDDEDIYVLSDDPKPDNENTDNDETAE